MKTTEVHFRMSRSSYRNRISDEVPVTKGKEKPGKTGRPPKPEQDQRTTMKLVVEAQYSALDR
jgi:hypothetical protein